jgi:hypothetical protein
MASIISMSLHQELYFRWHNEYLGLADFVFDYEGDDLGELISLLREFITSISTRAEESADAPAGVRQSFAGNSIVNSSVR